MSGVVLLGDSKENCFPVESQGKRRELELRLAGYAGSDPLEPWKELIVFSVEELLHWHKAGASHWEQEKQSLQTLFPLLEKACRTFASSRLYRDHPTYVSLWITYASLVTSEGQLEIFRRMRKQQIGQNLAIYYEAFAHALELRGAFTACEYAFEEGLSKEEPPTPVCALEVSYSKFQARRQFKQKNTSPMPGSLLKDYKIPGGRKLNPECAELRKHPLVHFPDLLGDASSSSSSGTDRISSRPGAVQRRENPAYDREAINSNVDDTNAWSFEEVRAQKMGFLNRRQKQPATNRTAVPQVVPSRHTAVNSPDSTSLSSATQPLDPFARRRHNEDEPIGMPMRRRHHEDEPIGAHSQPLSDEVMLVQEPKRDPGKKNHTSLPAEDAEDTFPGCSSAEPTITTKMALQDVMSILSGPTDAAQGFPRRKRMNINPAKAPPAAAEPCTPQLVAPTGEKRGNAPMSFEVFCDETQKFKTPYSSGRPVIKSTPQDQNPLKKMTNGDMVKKVIGHSHHTPVGSTPSRRNLEDSSLDLSALSMSPEAFQPKNALARTPHNVGGKSAVSRPSSSGFAIFADVSGSTSTENSIPAQPKLMRTPQPSSSSSKGNSFSIFSDEVPSQKGLKTPQPQQQTPTVAAATTPAGSQSAILHRTPGSAGGSRLDTTDPSILTMTVDIPRLHVPSDEKGQRLFNPYFFDSIQTIEKAILGVVRNLDGFRDHSSTPAPFTHEDVQRFKQTLRSSNAYGEDPVIDLGTRSFRLTGILGGGAFADLFEATPEETVTVTSGFASMALKMQHNTETWEFYMLKRLERSYMWLPTVTEFHLFADRSFMLLAKNEYPSLLDMVNIFKQQNKKVEEAVIIFYGIELVKMVRKLFAEGVIHGDIKPDNLMIRFHESRTGRWDDWHPEGAEGWIDKGLLLIDFGRAIDLLMYPRDVMFTGNCHASGFQCVEMQLGEPWKCQIDTYGIAAVLHVLLHGSYMDVTQKKMSDGSSPWMPRTPFKRFWQVKLWEDTFRDLINMEASPDQCEHRLAVVQSRLEDYFLQNDVKRKGFKTLLRKHMEFVEAHMS